MRFAYELIVGLNWDGIGVIKMRKPFRIIIISLVILGTSGLILSLIAYLVDSDNKGKPETAIRIEAKLKLHREIQEVIRNTVQIGQRGILKNDVGMRGNIINGGSEVLVLDIDRRLIRSKIRVLSGRDADSEGWVPCEFVIRMSRGD